MGSARQIPLTAVAPCAPRIPPCGGFLIQLSNSQFASTKDAVEICIRVPAARSAPEACEPFRPRKQNEGVGNAGCTMHPRPRVQIAKSTRAQVTAGSPETPGIPARAGLRLIRDLPGVHDVLVTVIGAMR
jgi:hypothetical protein